MRLALSEFKLPAMSSKLFAQSAQPDALKEAAADNRNAVKKIVKNLRESYFSKDLTQMREEMAKTYEPALYMEEILLRYDNIYRRKKMCIRDSYMPTGADIRLLLLAVL